MKRCPECRRDYYDDSLLYCLDDGSALLNGPGAIYAAGESSYQYEPATEIIHSASLPNESGTRIFSAVNRPVDTANAIAVLPFVNMSRDEDAEYLSDGLAEELLNVLSRIQGLRVAGRTSAFSFKGKQTTFAEIGRQLNVSSVLEGSVRMAGNRVRIAVQLVDIGDGYRLWSQTYDRTVDDIFAIQDDIANSVVEELRVKLFGKKPGTDASRRVVSEIAEAVKGRAAKPEAQRLMLLGRFFLDKLTREDTVTGIQYFRQALDLDANSALCWAELGRAYSIEAGRGWVPVEQGVELARAAATRALEIEPGLAEGYALLGRIQITYDLDLAGAEASYRRAMDLAPGSSTVLDGASVLAYKLGRLDEALELGRRVLIQDPLSAPFWHNFALTAHAADLLCESEMALRRALELAPQRFVSRALLALVIMNDGRVDEALEQALLEPDEFWRLWALAIIYHRAALTSEADAALEKLTRENAAGNAYQLAEVHAMRGENDQAFAWLERAIADKDAGVTHGKTNPRFLHLRDDPRWADLQKRVGLPY